MSGARRRARSGTDAGRGPDGYRRVSGSATRGGVVLPGPRVRADVVDVYVFRRRSRARAGERIELLQLCRATAPLVGTWQPVMGHIEAGETAAEAARRELCEEVGLRAGSSELVEFWALEQVHPFYIEAIDAIVLSPRFAAEVRRSWSPVLDASHTAFRWVAWRERARAFMWPGQRAALEELATRCG